MAIKFGTSGWRAIIAEELTFSNVRRVAEAIARYLQPLKEGTVETGVASEPLPKILVGYDTRFLSRAFAEEVARIFLAHDFRVDLCTGPTPTPTIAYEVIRDKRRPFRGRSILPPATTRRNTMASSSLPRMGRRPCRK
jgi:phosphomannomutase